MTAASKTSLDASIPSGKSAPILAFACDGETLDQICRVIPGARRGVEVREGTIRDAIAAIEHDGTPTMLIVDITDSTSPAIDMANLIATGGANALTVLALGPANDINLYRSLISAGATDYLVKPVSNQDLRRSILTISQSGPEEESRSAGQIIVTIGARGGIGASSVASNIAWLLSREFGKTAALVDLDLHFGTGALHFDVEAGSGLRSALEDPDRIDSLLVASALVNCGDNLYVLAGEEAIEEAFRVEPEAVSRLMEELRQVVDVVVIDLPRHMIAASVPFLEQATAISVITDLTLAGLRDTMRIRKGLEQALANPRLTTVAARVGHAKAGELPVAEFEKSLGVKVDFQIQETPGLAKAALDGKPTVLASQKNTAAQAMRELTKRLSGLDVAKKKQRPWANLFRSR